MTINKLFLFKGFNNGLENAILQTVDEDGVETVFDLTGATIVVEVMFGSTVLASFNGTIITADEGTFYARPDSDDLDSLTVNSTYDYRVKVTNATYTDGRIFAFDGAGRRLKCTVLA